MPDPYDQYRAANAMIEHYGEFAPEYAARRVSDLTMLGDYHGAAHWSDTLAAIISRMAQKPPEAPAP
jgi:hypothetical protein